MYKINAFVRYENDQMRHHQLTRSGAGNGMSWSSVYDGHDLDQQSRGGKTPGN